MRTTSRTAAPRGGGIKAMRLGGDGRGVFGAGRDKADAAGEHRKRFFARGREQALRFEAFLQLLEGELQRAETNGLDILDVNLVFAASFVNADRAAHGDVQAVFGPELDAALLLLEEDAANLGAVIFKGEVDVAGLGFAAIGDFALDPDIREILAEKIADAGGEFANGPGPAGGLEVESELAHGRKWPVTSDE